MHLSLVLEYAPHGNLVALLRKRGSNGKSNSQWSSLVRCILLQVCQAVAYLQTMQIAHRDIKPENILVHEIVGGDEIVEQAVPRPGWHPRAPILVKLCDFGAAVRWTPDQRQSTLCGTAEYVPPEMVTPSHSTEKCGAISYSAEYVDPWMLGVLAYELRNATTPFCPTLYERVTALSEDELYDAIYAKIRNFTRLVATSTSSSEAFFHDFVCRLLQVDPQKRMTAKETIGHCYFEQKPANALSPYTGSPAVPTFAAMEKNPASTAVAKRRPFFDSLGPVCGCAVERQVSSAR